MELFACAVKQCSQVDPIAVATLIVALIGVIVAYRIPRKIMVNQVYSLFLDAYRSPEMGGAILSLMHFFTYDCHNNIGQIEAAYISRYKVEIKTHLDNHESIDFSRTLHFRRRLVAYWYWQLAKLRYDYGIAGLSKKQLQKDFTENETHLLSLIYHMGPAAKKCFEDISRISAPDDEREGVMDTQLYRLYEESEAWE
jgi:hypothetical protein